MTTTRQRILNKNYYLFETEDNLHVQAAKEIDAAIEKAVDLVDNYIDSGLSFKDSIYTVLRLHVSPVMEKYKNLGSGDTEPQWAVVDVFRFILAQKNEFTQSFVESLADGYDMRFCL